MTFTVVRLFCSTVKMNLPRNRYWSYSEQNLQLYTAECSPGHLRHDAWPAPACRLGSCVVSQRCQARPLGQGWFATQAWWFVYITSRFLHGWILYYLPAKMPEHCEGSSSGSRSFGIRLLAWIPQPYTQVGESAHSIVRQRKSLLHHAFGEACWCVSWISLAGRHLWQAGAMPPRTELSVYCECAVEVVENIWQLKSREWIWIETKRLQRPLMPCWMCGAEQNTIEQPDTIPSESSVHLSRRLIHSGLGLSDGRQS